MSSAICFNLDQSKILTSGNELTLLLDKKIVDLSKQKAFAYSRLNGREGDIVGKGKKMVVSDNLLF